MSNMQRTLSLIDRGIGRFFEIPLSEKFADYYLSLDNTYRRINFLENLKTELLNIVLKQANVARIDKVMDWRDGIVIKAETAECGALKIDISILLYTDYRCEITVMCADKNRVEFLDKLATRIAETVVKQLEEENKRAQAEESGE